MKQYIDKAAVVAEIERRIVSLEGIGSESYLHDNYPEQYAMLATLKSLKFSLDTLEVKEVDLDEEFDRYCENLYLIDLENEPYAELFECAKYFFELGLMVKK